jgi:hypothetical protein
MKRKDPESMSIRLALGAVIAVLSAMLVLPGIASAHEPSVNTEAECNGTFSIDADYSGGTGALREYVSIDGENWDDDFPGGPPAGMTVTDDDVAYNHSPGDDYYLFEDVDEAEDFFVLSGDYQSVVDNGGDVTVYVSQTLNLPNQPENSGAEGTIAAETSWEECRITYCEAGDHNGGNDLSFLATPDSDCDPVRICVDGESMTVTEFDAEGLDGEKGSCTPSEEPPPPPPTITEEPTPEAVEEPEEAVAEVSPAVDEVVALPAAGYGESSTTTYAWAAVIAVALLGVGGATAVAIRPRR